MSVAAPFTLPNGQVFRNRIAKAAMTEGLAGADGVPNAAHEALYRRWAAGGCGLLITGNVVIDRAHRERPGNVVVDGALTPEPAPLGRAGRRPPPKTARRRGCRSATPAGRRRNW